jgi:hypothetical protein
MATAKSDSLTLKKTAFGPFFWLWVEPRKSRNTASQGMKQLAPGPPCQPPLRLSSVTMVGL